MGKKGVEVWLSAEVEDLVKVRMVDMGKDTKELAVDIFDGCGEGRVEWLTCKKYTLVKVGYDREGRKETHCFW